MLLRRAPWQAHREHRPLAGSLATVTSPPIMRAKLARDGKAEPRPAVAAHGQGIGLGEILEQLRLLLRRHTDAGIRYRELDPNSAI